MPAARRGPLLTLLWRYHRFWYGLTGDWIGAKRFRARAREAQATERELLWDKIVSRDANGAEYERRTKRRIPVLPLERSV
jgi:hypothetical protein